MKKIILLFVLGLILISLFIYYIFSLPKVSVIVPVYNTEKYLDDCLKSLKKQTLKNIEFIVIDDGSIDKSYEIMQKYAKNDKRFRIFKQNNKGVGQTRNFGMIQARGEYIGFVDSDDYVSPNYFEKLYDVSKVYNADVSVIVNTIRFSDKRKQYDYTFALPYIKKGVIDNINFLIGNMGQQWDKIYKKSFLEKHNIKSYAEKLWFEDEWFSSLVALYAHKIAITDKTLYYYRYNPEGITQSSYMTKDIFRKGLQLYGNLIKRIWSEDFTDNKKIELSILVYNKIRWYIDTYWKFDKKPKELDDYYECFRYSNSKPSKFCLFEND